ncbi:MAG: TusE/DsrC/DsvC family sulfur relay protein [Proteobacteria bacterium]|nr:TusE/DsrC/DsvC family sulfur relay protein [Pseudomonadota bacterium]
MADTQIKIQTVSFEDGRSYSLDQHGYLDPPEQWDENFAEEMAKKQGIFAGLTDEHWSFIRYLRKKFIEENTVPLILTACMDNNIRLSKLRSMFPSGYHRGACKLAGINYAFMSKVNIWITYENYTTLKTEFKLTETGYLEDFQKWGERFAMLVLHESDQPQQMTGQHRKIITFLRDYFAHAKGIPTVYETCKSNHITLKELMRLFPAGYRRGACRAAGLPFFG